MIFFSKLISYHNYFWQASNVWRISLAVSTVNSKYQSKSRSVLSQHVNTKFWNCWFFSAVDYYYCYDYYRSTYNEWIGSFKSILTQSFWDLSRHSWSWFIFFGLYCLNKNNLCWNKSWDLFLHVDSNIFNCQFFLGMSIVITGMNFKSQSWYQSTPWFLF